MDSICSLVNWKLSCFALCHFHVDAESPGSPSATTDSDCCMKHLSLLDMRLIDTIHVVVSHILKSVLMKQDSGVRLLVFPNVVSATSVVPTSTQYFFWFFPTQRSLFSHTHSIHAAHLLSPQCLVR